VAESGAAALLDESILKQDLAAEGATAAETVDSDRAQAMFAAHTPSANADFWSKLARSTDPPTARTGVTKNGPALEPVSKVATAVKPAAAGGETLPSTNEFPEEEPAPAASAWQSCAPASANPLSDPVSRSVQGDADWNVSTKEFPEEKRAPAVSASQHPSVHTRVLRGHGVLQAGTHIDPVTSRLPHVARRASTWPPPRSARASATCQRTRRQ